ncbi:unnamed protein product [Paramecium primaurelia]|uniref:Uncharacterized protein n=1 Tax=Paramecium primaurelia TaxID=5886 RepID=A0A8S1P0G9_PARPR|nr:unnamed protein product [Paramecium primaurelia]
MKSTIKQRWMVEFIYFSGIFLPKLVCLVDNNFTLVIKLNSINLKYPLTNDQQSHQSILNILIMNNTIEKRIYYKKYLISKVIN